MCRQWQANGVLSSDEPNSDKHKMERFLHEGRHSMLSCIAPLAFGNLPLLAFHQDEHGDLQLAASGRYLHPVKLSIIPGAWTGCRGGLHEGRHSMPSCIGPLTFGNLPLLAFHQDVDGTLQLAASGTLSESVMTEAAHIAVKTDPDGISLPNSMLSMMGPLTISRVCHASHKSL